VLERMMCAGRIRNPRELELFRDRARDGRCAWARAEMVERGGGEGPACLSAQRELVKAILDQKQVPCSEYSEHSRRM
jgi:hypothetical protein